MPKQITKILFISFSLSLLFNLLPINSLFASSPIDITQTNVRNDRFSISWVTEIEEIGQVNYGTTPSLGKTAYDDRGQLTSSKTHHITLTGLLANTQYYYEIVSGGQTYNNAGQPYTLTTGPILNPPSGSHVAYGQVFLSSGAPANGAIATLRLEDQDSLGSPGTSQTLSMLVDSAGWWNTELNSLRTPDLSNYFSFSESGDNEIISVRIDKYAPTIITIDTANDHRAPNITLGWVLNMIEMPWYQNQKPYYTGTATCQMLLNYIRQGTGVPDLTQDEIYNHAHPNPDSQDLTPNEVDLALGHFDPYDSLVSNSFDTYDSRPDGNPYQGYNFSVDAYNSQDPNALNEYMRDICHWMAFTVTQEEWWKRGVLVARPNTPAAVPIFGDTQGYNHWVAVKGAATSSNPAPEPLQNPWNTPDFTVYGFWMKDPLVSGIGENKYATVDECKYTYFKPLNTSDAYNGMYLQVAEPPAQKSRARVKLARPIPDSRNIVLVKLALGELKSEPQKEKLRQTYLKPKKKDLNWRNIVDPLLLTDQEATEAFADTSPGQPILVRRLDTRNKDYYLIAYRKKRTTPRQLYLPQRYLVSGVIIIDARQGYFKEAAWMKKPTLYFIISKGMAIQLVKRNLPRQFNAKNIKARLVWQPSRYSSSPYKPFWEIVVGKNTWYVTQEGKVYKVK